MFLCHNPTVNDGLWIDLKPSRVLVFVVSPSDSLRSRLFKVSVDPTKVLKGPYLGISLQLYVL